MISLHHAEGNRTGGNRENRVCMRSVAWNEKWWVIFSAVLFSFAVSFSSCRSHKRKRHIQGFTTGMSEAAFFFTYAITFAFGAFLIEERLSTFNDVFKYVWPFSATLFGSSYADCADHPLHHNWVWAILFPLAFSLSLIQQPLRWWRSNAILCVADYKVIQDMSWRIFLMWLRNVKYAYRKILLN